MTPLQKRGRRAKYVLGDDGKQIIGLSLDKGTKTYYATGTNPKVQFGRDFANALFKFAQWQAEKEGDTTTAITVKDVEGGVKLNKKFTAIKTPITLTKLPHKIGQTLRYKSSGGLKIIKEEVEIPEQIIIQKCKNLFAKYRDDMPELAKKLGIPELARLRQLKNLAPSITLKEVGDFYFSSELSKDELRKCKNAWKEFTKAIKVKTVEHITDDHILDYRNYIINKYRQGGYQPSYVNGRFGRVKTVFNYSIDEGKKDKDNLITVKGYCSKLKKIDTGDEENANPITIEDLHKLLSVADNKWKAIIITALNCAYSGRDIQALQKPYLKMKYGLNVIDFPRTKNNNKRLSVLFDETVNALEVYQEERPHDSKYIFVNQTGGSIDPHDIQRGFARLRKKVGIDDDVKFNNLRDGAATAMFGEVDPELLNLVIGHKIKGEKKKYIGVKPMLLKQCSDIIRKEYFNA